MSLSKLKQRAFENQEVKDEYDKLESEFSLADALLSMRTKSGLTQDDIAARMGTQKSNVCRLEKGGSNPSWKTIQKYANACGFSVALSKKSMAI